MNLIIAYLETPTHFQKICKSTTRQQPHASFRRGEPCVRPVGGHSHEFSNSILGEGRNMLRPYRLLNLCAARNSFWEFIASLLGERRNMLRPYGGVLARGVA